MTEEKDNPPARTGRPPSGWARLRARLGLALGTDFIILAIMAAILGVAVGFAAIAFRLGIAAVQTLGFGSPDEAVFLDLSHLPWWQIVLVPTAGGLLVGLILQFVLKHHRVHAVPEVMEATAGRGRRLGFWEGLTSAVAAAVSLGVGASTGREGPIVHLGATIASWLGYTLHLSRNLVRTLLGCGVAAAVAASFNAPIAGVFFALEVIIGHYAINAFAPIVLAAVAGTVVSRSYFGNFPAFVVTEYELGSFWEFPAFIVLGVLAAIVTVLFVRAWQAAMKAFDRVNPPMVVRPAIGGAIVGLLALQFPQILSVGYAATDAALTEGLTIQVLVALLVLKTGATAVCLAARFGGGVFSPSLFIGAMLGGAFGFAMMALFPDVAGSTGAYAVVGMGAVASAVLGAPISTTLIVFELTGDYQITIALMVAVAVAAILTRQLLRGSFFHMQLLRRGLDVRGTRGEQLVRWARVSQAMQTDVEILTAATPMADLAHSHHPALVCDAGGAVIGLLDPEARDTHVEEGTTVGDMAQRPKVLTQRDGLERALTLFQETDLDALPVVTDAQSRQPAGILTEREALRAYNRLLIEARLEEQGRPSRPPI